MTHVRISYGEFYDVPREFTVRWGDRVFLFESPFDKRLDDYPDVYEVYELPSEEAVRFDVLTRDEIAGLARRHVGTIPVKHVPFDTTRRQTIDDSVFRTLGIG